MEKRSKAESLREWLEKTGFPFEMEIARATQESGEFSIAPSVYYAADDRVVEIDGLAWRGSRVGAAQRGLTLYLTIECHVSSKPYIVLQYQPPENLRPHYTLEHPASVAGRALLERAADRVGDPRLGLFAPTQMVGYSALTGWVDDGADQQAVREASSATKKPKADDKDENTFVALRKVRSAANAARWAARKNPECDKLEGPLVVVLPVVVVRGDLFEAAWDKASGLSMHEVGQSRIFWRRAAEERGTTIVYMVRHDTYRQFLTSARDTFLALRDTAEGWLKA
jgi:hypothetical protein